MLIRKKDMVRKTLILVALAVLLVCPAAFSSEPDVSGFITRTRQGLPEEIQPFYAKNRFWFEFGQHIAPHVAQNIDPARVYEKMVSVIRRTRNYNAVAALFHGIFSHMVVTDFFVKSQASVFPAADDFSCTYTGTAVFDTFADFEQKKSFHESVLSRYAGFIDDSLLYQGLWQNQVCGFSDALADLHATLLRQGGVISDFVFLKTGAPQYHPSDRLVVTLTSDRLDSGALKSLAVTDAGTGQEILSAAARDMVRTDTALVLDTVLPNTGVYGPAVVSAVFGMPDGTEAAASLDIAISSSYDIEAGDLEFAPFVLDIYENHTLKGTKLLLPFDFIFVGGFPDDPETELDEGAANLAIPGDFTHLVMYLGRLLDGTPVGAEMTTSLIPKTHSVRLVSFEEDPDTWFDSSSLDLPLVTVNPYKYRNVDARRLRSPHREQVFYHAYALFSRVLSDIYGAFPYEFQFSWSGDLKDTRIYLVDDGLENGASCAEYWLSLFEQIPGVCIRGSRISREGLIDYFLNDPVGSTVKIPDTFNPFPFELYVKTLLGSIFNFDVIDPAPHVFPCDNTTETGIPIPDRLYHSPDLTDIAFLP